MRGIKVIVICVCVVLITGLFSGCGNEREIAGHDNKPQMPEELNNTNVLQKKEVKSIKEEGLLKGKTICIDPGHQSKGNSQKEPIAPGSDVLKEKTTSGTAGVVTGIPEYRLVLDISLLIRDKLEKYGAKVVMTRESHNVDISNIERAKLANGINADLSVRVHADGAMDKKVRGPSVLYPGPKYIKDIEIIKKSKAAALKVSKSIRVNSRAVSVKTAERNDLTGFNWSAVPVILVEVGFMSNPDEDRLMKTEKYRERMAEGIVQGVTEYFQ